MKKYPPSKAETALLDSFNGIPMERVHIPKKKSEYAAAVEEILAFGHVGFDTESKPIFKPGEVSNGPHVVQFALRERAYIFQLFRSDCRKYLTEILESEDVLKVGFGLQSDGRHIHRSLGVKLRAVVDLNNVFRNDGYRGTVGVRAAVGVVLNQRFHKSKKTTTSNWARPQLTTRQLLYAANDAFAALTVFDALNLPREALPITGLTRAKGARR